MVKKNKLRKIVTPETGRSTHTKQIINNLIDQIETHFNATNQNYPSELLLRQLYFIKGFIEKIKFPEDDELIAKRKALARQNAGRPKLKVKKPTTPLQAAFCRFLATGKVKHYDIYMAWAEENDESEIIDRRYFNKLKTQKFNCSSRD